MKMGKVFDKLKALPAVKCIQDAGDTALIVLADGYANDGKVECNVATAHAARIWIEGASNGTTSTSRKRTVRVITEDGEEIVQHIEEVKVAKWPGVTAEEVATLPPFNERRDFDYNAFEGRCAFRRGFDIKSHYRGESLGGREFEAGWKQEQRNQAAADARLVAEQRSAAEGLTQLAA